MRLKLVIAALCAFGLCSCSLPTRDSGQLELPSATQAVGTSRGDEPATTVTFTLFKSASDPRFADDNLALGPDGAFWYANYKGPAIVRFQRNGIWSTFSVPAYNGAEVDPSDIVTGPDGRLWFGNRNGSGVIGAMKVTGKVTEYPIMGGSYAFNLGSITNGLDIWFTGTSYASKPDIVGYIDVSTGAATIFQLPGSGQGDHQIVLGPDGNLWFAYGYSIGRITPGGSVSFFSTQPEMDTGSIIVGPDGDLWFIGHGDADVVERMDVNGNILSEQALTTGDTNELVVGPDKKVWITSRYELFHHSYLVRMDSPTQYTSYRIPKATYYAPDGIVVGKDGNLWFNLYGTGNPEQHGIGMGTLTMPRP